MDWRPFLARPIQLRTVPVVLVGGGFLFYGIAADTSNGDGLLWILSGMVLTLGGLLFACIGVRCPKCRARWVWMAVSERCSTTYGTWLIALSACPRCGDDGSKTSI